MSGPAPLCDSPLNSVERQRLLGLLDALCGYLGSPGDWGYGTQLGDLTLRALNVRNLVRTAPANPPPRHP